MAQSGRIAQDREVGGKPLGMRRHHVKFGELLRSVETRDVPVDDIEIAVSKKRKADRILFVEKAESRSEIAKLVGMSGIKCDTEAVACKGFVVIETDWNVIDVVSLVLGLSTVG